MTAAGCASLLKCSWNQNLLHLNLSTYIAIKAETKLRMLAACIFQKNNFHNFKCCTFVSIFLQDECSIEDEGCYHLGRLKACKIKTLSIRWIKIIERETFSGKEDAKVFQEGIGLDFNFLMLVRKYLLRWTSYWRKGDDLPRQSKMVKSQ